jgi:hypothetical protein
MRRAITFGALALFAAASTAVHADVVINELRIEQPDADNDEYFELAGPAETSLDGLTYLVLGDGTGASGVIEAVVDLTGQTIGASGYFVVAEGTFTLGVADYVASLNFENSDNVTHLLVQDFTGTQGDDLDTDDDGVLDVTPWTTVLDAIGLVESVGSGEFYYGEALGFIDLGPDGSLVPSQAYRCSPDGTWTIGVSDPIGTTDTPGAVNTPCEAPECPEDVNEDGYVDVLDLLAVIAAWGPCPQ